VTIRLLDPPLHEFLPEGDMEEIVGGLTADIGMSADEIHSRVEKLCEVNPMLGFRGCRSSTYCASCMHVIVLI
jgi:pyruvate,orthophosphate dikinase